MIGFKIGWRQISGIPQLVLLQPDGSFFPNQVEITVQSHHRDMARATMTFHIDGEAIGFEAQDAVRD